MASRNNITQKKSPTILNHKGMEMWQIVFIILALILLLFMLAWSGQLGTKMETTLNGFGSMF